MKIKSCKNCVHKGYKKENGDIVCRDGKNFDYRSLRYDVDRAKTCREYCYNPEPQEPEAVF